MTMMEFSLHLHSSGFPQLLLISHLSSYSELRMGQDNSQISRHHHLMHANCINASIYFFYMCLTSQFLPLCIQTTLYSTILSHCLRYVSAYSYTQSSHSFPLDASPSQNTHLSSHPTKRLFPQHFSLQLVIINHHPV